MYHEIDKSCFLFSVNTSTHIGNSIPTILSNVWACFFDKIDKRTSWIRSSKGIRFSHAEALMGNDINWQHVGVMSVTVQPQAKTGDDDFWHKNNTRSFTQVNYWKKKQHRLSLLNHMELQQRKFLNVPITYPTLVVIIPVRLIKFPQWGIQLT